MELEVPLADWKQEGKESEVQEVLRQEPDSGEKTNIGETLWYYIYDNSK